METKDKESNPGSGCITAAVIFFIIAAVGAGLGLVFNGGSFIESTDGKNVISNLRIFFVAVIIGIGIWLFNHYKNRGPKK